MTLGGPENPTVAEGRAPKDVAAEAQTHRESAAQEQDGTAHHHDPEHQLGSSRRPLEPRVWAGFPHLLSAIPVPPPLRALRILRQVGGVVLNPQKPQRPHTTLLKHRGPLSLAHVMLP